MEYHPCPDCSNKHPWPTGARPCPNKDKKITKKVPVRGGYTGLPIKPKVTITSSGVDHPQAEFDRATYQRTYMKEYMRAYRKRKKT
jgi:hypothetical protein